MRYAPSAARHRTTALGPCQPARHVPVKEVAEDYRQGRATLWEVANRLGVSYREADEALHSHALVSQHVAPLRPDRHSPRLGERLLSRTDQRPTGS